MMELSIVKRLPVIMLAGLVMALTGNAVAGNAPTGYKAVLTLSPKPDAENGLLLSLSTKKMFRTGGYSLEADCSVDGNKIIIGLKPVKAPEQGRSLTMALAPARTTVPLPSDKGDYQLIIKDNDETAVLKLAITDETIELTSETDTPLFGSVSLSYNLPPKDVIGVTAVYRKAKGGEDDTEAIRKKILSLPGASVWVPKKGRYLARAGVVSNKNVTYYKMEKGIDWDAVKAVVANCKGNPSMYVSVAVPSDGRTVKNR